MDVVRAAFALTPEYLQTVERGAVHNLMDTGVQLGRRFRSLKLWMILRSFGARQLREHISRHIELAQKFAGWVDAHPDFERMAPVPFSVVCFRWNPENSVNPANPVNPVNPSNPVNLVNPVNPISASALDVANEELLNRVNETGEVYLSHTRIRGRLVLRLAIGHLRTTETHVRRAWDLLIAHAGPRPS